MAESSKESAKVVPPYISATTFLNGLQSISETGVPQVIDGSVLRKFSGSAQRQVMQALRYLKFTNGNDQRTEQFVSYAKADADGRKAILRDLLTKHYPTQAAILPDGSMQQLQTSFAEFQVEPSVRSKCVAFLIQLAKHSGLPVSAHIAKGTRTSAPRKTTKTAKTKNEDKGKIPEFDSVGKDDPSMTSIPIPLGPGKTWHIKVETKPAQADVDRFLQVIRIVLGATPDKPKQPDGGTR